MEYCLVVLWLLRERIRRKQTENALIFQRNIVLSHSIMSMTDFLAKHETRVIAQPRYSIYLACCDFFLLSKLKICFGKDAMSPLDQNIKIATQTIRSVVSIKRLYQSRKIIFINSVRSCILNGPVWVTFEIKVCIRHFRLNSFLLATVTFRVEKVRWEWSRIIRNNIFF